MSKVTVFTMKLEPELRDEFMAEAEAAHRSASQVVHELMREFVRRQRNARDHEAFVRRKVEIARSSMHAGRGISNEDIEIDFTVHRAEVANRG